ncbi:MAG: hypothetical protein WCI26_11460 [Acidimicrobiales bacterium]
MTSSSELPLCFPADTQIVVAAGLLGVADLGDGPTDEQYRVVAALARNLWSIELLGTERASPAEVAASLPDSSKRRFVQWAMVVQFCRHPASRDQEERLVEYATALGVEGPPLDALASWISKDAVAASADYVRNYQRFISDLSEPIEMSADGGEVLPQVRALFDLPEGTLGWAYLQFYERHGFHLPGPHTPEPAYYISHDMNHVIAGYEPDGPGEIALGAFKVGMSDSDANWMAFVTNLMIQEAGLIKHGLTEEAQFVPYGGDVYGDDQGQGALHLPGAEALLAEALRRGASVRQDFSQVDHLAMAHRSVADIREEFHVMPRADGFDEVFRPKYP